MLSQKFFQVGISQKKKKPTSFVQCTKLEIISIHHECQGGIEKSVPRITDWHHEAYRVMTIGDRERRIFLSHAHTNNGFFFLLTTKIFHFILKKHEKDFQKFLHSLKCDMVTSFEYYIDDYNDVTERRVASVWLFVFFIFP